MAEPSQFALVIGAGPAGLMAAEALALAGHPVIVTEAKPTLARKFLMAGKSGLNITKDEPLAPFLAQYDRPEELRPMLTAFGPAQVQDWCRALGQEVFTGTSGRVFPVAMKASPLLRAWAARLTGLGVDLRLRWRWTGRTGEVMEFDTPHGHQALSPRVTVLAMGGASWSRLGSDGSFVPVLQKAGVPMAPWQPANMGLWVDWSSHMTRHFGSAVKGAALQAADHISRGEFVISSKGLEGGGIYALSRTLRSGAALHMDLMPGLSSADLQNRLSQMRAGESLPNRLRKLGLSAPAAALVMEWGKGQPLATAIKQLAARHNGPRPLDEAISVAGGVMWNALSPSLELTGLPGVFVAGEMLDWEAPTGGYLLTACMATGLWAGRAAAAKLSAEPPADR